ncbi:hypothetical protein L484_009937 [Morus notabilis]|uniref:Uncharacterized protein n=1 Tax=Morus notabilis TaxID=981085 RepID=W9STH0_9ROSA|nr:hypothetical protein L484_009937 [Morus notabilis]
MKATIRTRQQRTETTAVSVCPFRVAVVKVAAANQWNFKKKNSSNEGFWGE